MNPADRRREADDIARKLANEGIERGLVYRDAVLTIQVDRGQVVFVE